MSAIEPAEEELLLPWYVSGRLTPEERGRVDRALAASPALRRALDAERHLQAAVATAPAPPPPAIDPESLLASAAPEPALPRWVNPVLAAAAVLILVQAAALVWGVQPAVYRTAAGPAPAPRADAMRYAVHFQDEATAARIRSVLDEAEARIVRGPMPDGAFIIEFGDEDRALGLLSRSGVARAIAPTD